PGRAPGTGGDEQQERDRGEDRHPPAAGPHRALLTAAVLPAAVFVSTVALNGSPGTSVLTVPAASASGTRTTVSWSGVASASAPTSGTTRSTVATTRWSRPGPSM